MPAAGVGVVFVVLTIDVVCFTRATIGVVTLAVDLHVTGIRRPAFGSDFRFFFRTSCTLERSIVGFAATAGASAMGSAFVFFFVRALAARCRMIVRRTVWHRSHSDFIIELVDLRYFFAKICSPAERPFA